MCQENARVEGKWRPHSDIRALLLCSTLFALLCLLRCAPSTAEDADDQEQKAIAGIRWLGGYVVERRHGGRRSLSVDLAGASAEKDLGLARLWKLTDVESLALSYSDVTDVQLEQLAGRWQLRELKLHGNRGITDESLEHIAELKSLRSLSICCTSVGDEGLRHLAGMKQLESLSLAFSNVGDEGMNHVSRLESLKQLDLTASRVSDVGLRKLRALGDLKELSVRFTDVSDKGIAELMEALPELTVRSGDRRRKDNLEDGGADTGNGSQQPRRNHGGVCASLQ